MEKFLTSYGVQKIKWESILTHAYGDRPQSSASRMPVHRGWLVYSVVDGHESTIFVPDANHEWKIETIKTGEAP